MTPIKNILESLLGFLSLPYAIKENGLYEINIGFTSVFCEINEDIRVFKFFGHNGIIISENARSECLEYLNYLTFQWDAISFFLLDNNKYCVCSSGCAIGYEATPEKLKIYLFVMLQKLLDEEINKNLMAFC